MSVRFLLKCKCFALHQRRFHRFTPVRASSLCPDTNGFATDFPLATEFYLYSFHFNVGISGWKFWILLVEKVIMKHFVVGIGMLPVNKHRNEHEMFGAHFGTHEEWIQSETCISSRPSSFDPSVRAYECIKKLLRALSRVRCMLRKYLREFHLF